MIRLTLLFLLLLTGPIQAKEKLFVVSSFSILGDIVQNVGGDFIAVHSIVGPNGDTHVYKPTPQDSKFITKADLVVINGLKFETWFQRLIEASGYRGPVAVASKGIAFHNMMEPQFSTEPVPDPHVWSNARHVINWVHNIKDALQKADPNHREAYEKNASAYIKELEKLDCWIKGQFKGIPKESCKVITAHDAFNYFEKAYGLVFLSPQGISTMDEPSAHEMVSLIQQIKTEKITTIFVENISSQHLIKQLASETGAKIGGTLYSDALSEKGDPGETYLKMMRHNVSTLVASLGCVVSP